MKSKKQRNEYELKFLYGKEYYNKHYSKSARLRKSLKSQNKKRAYRYSLKLENKPTKQELVLKKKLENECILFWFQKPFYDYDGCYIADFYFHNAGKKYKHLIVEVDGIGHKYQNQHKHDYRRNFWLKFVKNCETLRFTNRQVEEEIDNVINKIKSYNIIINNIEEKLDYYAMKNNYIP